MDVHKRPTLNQLNIMQANYTRDYNRCHYVAVKLYELGMFIVLDANARSCTVHMLGMALQTHTAPT
jgi:hypothetical protein